MNRYLWFALAVALLLLFAFGSRLAGIFVDLLWFQELGYRAVYLGILRTQILLGLAMGAAFFLIVYANIRIARRWAPPVPRQYVELAIRERAAELARRSFNLLLLAGALVAAVAAALEASTHWQSALLYANPVSFGRADPLFGQDVGFYVFRLPFLLYLYQWLVFTLVVALLATAGVHYFDKALQVVMGVPRFAPHVKVHLSVLAAIILLVRAWGYQLAKYKLLFSPGNLIYGANYADVHARLPAIAILQVACVVLAAIFIFSIYRRGVVLPIAGLGALLLLSLLAGTVYPQMVQSVKVTPNETTLERPYIQNHIRATLDAYGLTPVKDQEFGESRMLTAEIINQHQGTIDNLRLWDHVPLLNAYSQQQSLRLYYEFADVDVDRYTVGGQERQVMLAARELNPARIPVSSWIGRHLQYTHGYGLVMSQVNAASAEGWPQYLIKDIDPMLSVAPELKVTTPQVYYGEADPDYCFVNTAVAEFDHPRGDQNVTNTYSGTGGFPIGGAVRRSILAFQLGDANILLSRDLRPTSRLMLRRTVPDRVRAVAPFLLQDPDPYLVLSDGRLYWMLDCYTTSSFYPYSAPAFEGGYNYLRNSVKAVVDAYNGSVTLYVSDPTDPIVRSYSRVFPALFVPISRMPAGLRSHIRYPELLFNKQTEVYGTYHMRDPLVFYQKEDVWTIAKELGSTDSTQSRRIEAYYVMMRLPGSDHTEMVLMRPFTARGKDNMVAWMAARCDSQDYGEIQVYKFPKTALAEGPSQVEARINNDPTISPQISLWDQRGSQVIHGHLLVIPIGGTVLYVRPLYLQAEAASSPIPELTRIILASDNPRRVVMERTLQDALRALVAGEAGEVAPEQQPVRPYAATGPQQAVTQSLPPNAQRLVREAWQRLQAAESAQRRGDWAAYGRELQGLRSALSQLQSGGTANR